MGIRLAAAACCLVVSFSAVAQETRSMLFGRVLDSQGSAIVGAAVTIRNADTGVSLSYKTNATGYYEGNLLMPGSYEITAEMKGFKKLIRHGVTLPVSSRIQVDLPLEVGGVTETVNVSAEAPLLETNAVSSGRVIDNKSLMELPVMGNSAILLVKLAPGIQTGGVNNYLALHSNAGGSDYSVGGNIGGNSWTLDGSPNQGPGRRTAYLPYTDAVGEFKVETNNFDASIGQASGAAISMISKSGNNDFHGTATWQHWQQRWQGTPFFVKQNYYRSIAQAEAAGNTARANEIRNTDKQATGRSNNWGASGGGPVVIPKVYDGRNRLFWFFTYNAFKDVKTEDASNFNRTVPTLKARQGDFSDMLQLTNNPSRYVVHDPTTVRRDPARPNNFIRDPIPGNVIPRSRFANPAYDAIMKLYPQPNVAIAAGADPVNNYLASKTPYNWDYKAYSNRVDYQISDKWRMFARWSYNNFGPEDRGDWTYETARGLNLGGLVRNNIGGGFDFVFTQNATTLWNVNVGINQFREGSIQPKALEYKPSDIGLPTYLDQKAGDLHILPQMAVGGYTTISPGGISTWTRTRQQTAKVGLTLIRGTHSISTAFDNRNHFRTGGGGGNTGGNFSFNQNYVRRNDDGFTPASDLGLGWAAFILGVPSGASVATNDTYAMHNPYYATYVQDSWRINSKLTLNLGLRMEYERGATERYNRMIATFDPTLNVPIAAAAQAAYAQNPVAELPASQFIIKGGNTFAGVDGRPRQLYQNQLMWLPRVGAAYQLNSKTVVRGGYGIFYDTINVLNFGPDQAGFSRSTGSIITTDFGQTWNFPAGANPANFKSPLIDPFPLRADGTRFDAPTRDALGAMNRVGRGYNFTAFDQPHARQQRWQLGVQRQFGSTMVVNAYYAGSYSDRISINVDNGFRRTVTALPEQYWATGTVRNNTVADYLNANVPNPFYINNFNRGDFSPLVWADMNTNGFFTSPTIRRHQLLRPFSHMSSLNNSSEPSSYTKSHEFQATFEKRFAKGWNLNLAYTHLRLREADIFLNEFDANRTERPSNDGRPHRFTATGVYELPFGKGRKFLAGANRLTNLVAGGWQMAATYEFQPGPLIDFGNLFYYGNDVSNVANVNRSLETWFNTADFERMSARGPNSFHRRVFPTRIDGIRSDSTRQWNANVSKNIVITERVKMQLRINALNLQNRSQMGGPNTDPFSSNFGKITSQTAATNRWIEAQARITF
ncbi:MAG: carboxypeptidase regulatory-like domain-containing protein [Acidobacteria bacterium]|nr:carboxypeptidase regulatory-like domain-containing protein [Acidobacteriota bacterium]